MRQYPHYYPISGSDDLESGILSVFPEACRRSSALLTPECAEDLRGWLRDPAFAQEQRLRPIPLDDHQRTFVVDRNPPRHRRIRGPAGCGKSVVLACRADELASVRGKTVLVVGFNIALLNYLRDLSVRYAPGLGRMRRARRRIDFLNFHEWVKRVAKFREREDWPRIPEDASTDVVNRQLRARVDLAHRIYDHDSSYPGLPFYDAVLVDEGQDFLPEWWSLLRLACPRGEMMLVADRTRTSMGGVGSGPRSG